MKRLTLIIVSASLVMMSGCYYDNEETLYPQSSKTVQTCDTGIISYSQKVQPLLLAKCAISGCHSGTQSPDLRTYEVANGFSADIRGRITDPNSDSRMPPPGATQLTACELSNIVNWIDQGSQNN